jgi:FixJ family two-component response regulator
MSVQAMKGGAIDFLPKPFRDQDLIDAIQLGLARDRVRREDETELTILRERFEILSVREREVMYHVAKGHLNKQIAAAMAISEITVKVHRGQVMRKMRASSTPDLARMADKLKEYCQGSVTPSGFTVKFGLQIRAPNDQTNRL